MSIAKANKVMFEERRPERLEGVNRHEDPESRCTLFRARIRSRFHPRPYSYTVGRPTFRHEIG